MNTQLKINIHSLSFPITNSSTVTYITATTKTIEVIKELADAIIAYGYEDIPTPDDALKADDYFTFELVPSEKFIDIIMDTLADEYCNDESEIITEEERQEYHFSKIDEQEILEKKYQDLLKQEPKPDWWTDLEDDDTSEHVVKVTIKENSANNPHLIKIAEILSNLHLLFDISAKAEY